MATRDWRLDVLTALGAPASPANLRFLETWQRFEGGHTANNASFNWLNSTSGTQYPKINSVGVRAYPDWPTGVNYTVSTIRNGRYPSVVKGLVSGNPYNPGLRAGILGDLSTWVSGSRTGNLSYAAKVLGTSYQVPTATSATADPKPPGREGRHAGEQVASGVPGVSWVWNATKGVWEKSTQAIIDIVEAPEKAAGAVSSTWDAIKWPFENWDRVLEVVGGFVLVVAGLYLMGRSLGVTKTRIELVERRLPGGERRAAENRAAAAEQRAYTRAASSAGRERGRRSRSLEEEYPDAPAREVYDPRSSAIPY